MGKFIQVRWETKDLALKVKMIHSLPDAQKSYIEAVAYEQMSLVLRDSKTVSPRVPVDTGALQSTGHVVKPKLTSGGVSVTLSYGGLAGAPYNKIVDYAVVTHEDTRRKYQRPGAGPKYVSTHFQKRQGAITVNLVKAIKAATEDVFK